MVKSLLSILATRQNNILSGALILMVAVFLSKFLGLIKARLLLHFFTSDQAAIFFAAFKLPDSLFNFLIFGTLSVAFIPIFTDHLGKKGEKDAFSFASNILNLSLLVFGAVSVLAFIFVSPINSVLIPGFSGPQKDLTDQLTRLMLFPQFLLIIGSFFIGISQSYQRFIIPSLAPLFYNLGIIFGISVLSPFFGILGPAVGVIIGAALHVMIQLPYIKSLGFNYSFSFDFLNSGVKEVFKLMSMRNISLVVEHLSDLVGFALASLISYSSITFLTLSQLLYTAPVGLFGATIAQASLPVLSQESSKGEMSSFKVTLLTTMHQILFLTLPAAAILIVLRIPVVRLTFGASQFSWSDTVLTGRTVGLLAVGLAAQAVIMLLVRAFYALKDTKTPVAVSLVTFLVNVSLSLIFVKVMMLPVWGIALAMAVSTNLSVFMLLYFLYRKVGGFDIEALVYPALKMLLAATIAAVCLYVPIKALDELVFDTTRTINLIILTLIAASFGMSVYIFLVWILKVKELKTYVDLVRKVGDWQAQIRTREVIDQKSTV